MRQWLTTAGMASEIVSVFLVFAFFGALGTPGVNESHYLTKAKHFWNPAWCRGDLFLESTDAHYAFFLVCGWPTIFVSMEALAWCGRILCWLGMAVAWVRLNRSMNVPAFFSAASAALFALLSERFDLAGEWVVGGFEAKSVAYVFVIAALDLFIRRRWKWFWPAIGLACLFHAVIGIWAGICFAISLGALMLWAPRGSPSSGVLVAGWRTMYMPILIFLALLAIGCVPPMLANAGATPDVVSTANRIQVHQRLTHHLLFGSFETVRVASFAVMLTLWLVLTRLMPTNLNDRRLQWFCYGSLLISLMGLVLSGMAEQPVRFSDLANSLLRFYWFRFSDFAIPLGLSIFSVRLLAMLLNSHQRSKRNSALFCGAMIVIGSGLHVLETRFDLRPPADRASLPTYENDPIRTRQTFENWRKACRWVASNTPVDAVFLTPSRQQTFKWYAGRAEVACWKDAPQDAAGIVEWHRRISQLVWIETNVVGGFVGLTPEQVSEFAEQNHITYVIIEQSLVDAAKATPMESAERTDWRRIYPTDPNEKSTYVIFSFSIPDF